MKNLLGTQIKNIQVLITRAKLEIQNLNDEKKELQKNISLKEKQLIKYKKQLTSLQLGSTNTIISEHAIIRYLQRVYKLDLNKLQEEILPNNIQDKIIEYGNGTYNVNGFGIKVVDNVVVTLLDEIENKKQAHIKTAKKSKKQIEKNIIEDETQDMLDEYK